jgi:hypothetical protein
MNLLHMKDLLLENNIRMSFQKEEKEKKRKESV